MNTSFFSRTVRRNNGVISLNNSTFVSKYKPPCRYKTSYFIKSTNIEYTFDPVS